MVLYSDALVVGLCEVVGHLLVQVVERQLLVGKQVPFQQGVVVAEDDGQDGLLLGQRVLRVVDIGRQVGEHFAELRVERLGRLCDDVFLGDLLPPQRGDGLSVEVGGQVLVFGQACVGNDGHLVEVDLLGGDVLALHDAQVGTPQQVVLEVVLVEIHHRQANGRYDVIPVEDAGLGKDGVVLLDTDEGQFADDAKQRVLVEIECKAVAVGILHHDNLLQRVLLQSEFAERPEHLFLDGSLAVFLFGSDIAEQLWRDDVAKALAEPRHDDGIAGLYGTCGVDNPDGLLTGFRVVEGDIEHEQKAVAVAGVVNGDGALVEVGKEVAHV